MGDPPSAERVAGPPGRGLPRDGAWNGGSQAFLGKDAGSPNSRAIWATEDTAQGRSAIAISGARLREPPLGGLDPAVLVRDEHRLRTVNRADLAVDVVQVGPDGADGERKLGCDLLVHLAVRKASQGVDLAVRQRARVGVALERRTGVRELVKQWGDALTPEPKLLRRAGDRVGRDRVAARVGGRSGPRAGSR